MRIRKGKVKDLENLGWAWTPGTPTWHYFSRGIDRGRQEFWVVETSRGALIGEVHIFWCSVDDDEADGRNRAYLCAFRVHPDHRRQGIGTRLMRRALKRIREKGFGEATIGVERDASDLKALYFRWGFTTLVKVTNIDHHHPDHNGNPMPTSIPTELYMKRIGPTTGRPVYSLAQDSGEKGKPGNLSVNSQGPYSHATALVFSPG